MLIVSGQREKEFQHLFLRNACKIAFAELGIETGENELTGFDSIFLGVGIVILQMDVDCLGYFHDASPVVGFVDKKLPEVIIS